MIIVGASTILGLILVAALLLRRPGDAPSIERRVTAQYPKGFKGVALVCLVAHTAFFSAYAYGASQDGSAVWTVGMWEFGGFAFLAWWLVLESFFTVGWIDARGVGVRRLGAFERQLAWSDVEEVVESKVRGAVVLKGAGTRVAVPNVWGLNDEIAFRTGRA